MKKIFASKGLLFQLIITVTAISIIAALAISEFVSLSLRDISEEQYLQKACDVLNLSFVECDDRFQRLLELRQENQAGIEKALQQDVLLQIKNLSRTRGDFIQTAVLDETGKVLTSSFPSYGILKLESFPIGNNHNPYQNLKRVQFTDKFGNTLVGFVKYFPAWRWHLIAAIENRRLLAASKPARNIIFLGFCIEMAIFVLVFFFIFSRRIHGPLKKLIIATETLKSGNFQQLRWNRDDEMGLLAESFDRLAAGLEQREKQLTEANLAILESERRFRNIFENANDIILLIDKDGSILDINQRAEELLGYRKTEFLNKKFIDLMAPVCKGVGETLLRKIEIEGKADNIEIRAIHSSGKEIRLEASCRKYHDQRRKMVSTICVLRDITEKKRMEEEALATKNLLENVIEHSVDALVIIRNDGNIMRINQRFKDIFGFGTEESNGMHFSDLLQNKEDVEPLIEELEKKGVTVEKEVNCKIKTGEIIPVEVSAKRIYDSDREHHVTIVVGKDLREKKSLQSQLFRAQKMEAIGTLAGGIAHDFNNLLTVVKGFTQMLLLREPKGGSRRAYLEQIEHAANRASELTNQLLTFSRKVKSEKKPVELNGEITGVEKLLIRTLPKMIKVSTELTDKSTLISADPSQIEQIVINLAVNARDAMPDGGELKIKTEVVHLDYEYCRQHLGLRMGEYVLLSVTDNGMGMDRKTRERIFDPFFTTKEVGKGTGLGLAMVYGIVENHDGHIICYSEKGLGTTFKIYFPIYKSISLDVELRKESLEEHFPKGNETILIVDDEESVRDLGTDLLSKFGYRVLVAEDGKEAIKIYTENAQDIDLIILDFIMPGMDGKKCLRELLRIDPNVKVVMASGFALSGPLRNLVNEETQGFINKPFSLSSMLKMIRSVLGKTERTNNVSGSYL